MSGHCFVLDTQVGTKASFIGTAAAGHDCAAVIVAAGSGTRFGASEGKQFVKLCGLPLVAWSVLAFDEAPSCAQIVVVCPPGRKAEMADAILGKVHIATALKIVEGGATRQESSRLGVLAQDPKLAYTAIHDGARPLITGATIENALAHLRCAPELAGVVCAHPATDTLKIVDHEMVMSTPDRSLFWAVQTPQIFRRQRIIMYHEAAAKEGYVGTDDASLAEHYGGAIRCVKSPRSNLKVTVPEDLSLAEAILDQRLCSWQDERRQSSSKGEA
ncbi:MAG: 2-C-methyl-D-erythritol 4-phosphate cytidylyltransferase [Atopobiaceae bacterium]|jgi:2-C-methyl-D-erythritol 4-phosphate cytidylyltransferase|nr:2-C-methyl-D-erythritol 4-phosphate cytidylyltransferase [Atopobiaceae bacterium]MCI2050522.1 2-C-methyl-D-erythritol 4-phosphate cytidylyltransferase [Atopobiaceae bacterium]